MVIFYNWKLKYIFLISVLYCMDNVQLEFFVVIFIFHIIFQYSMKQILVNSACCYMINKRLPFGALNWHHANNDHYRIETTHRELMLFFYYSLQSNDRYKIHKVDRSIYLWKLDISRIRWRSFFATRLSVRSIPMLKNDRKVKKETIVVLVRKFMS